MATSGTTTFSVTRNEVIAASLRLLGVLEEGASPTAQAIENSSLVLNMMLKDWMTDGIKLWTVKELTLPLVANQNMGARFYGRPIVQLESVAHQMQALTEPRQFCQSWAINSDP